ncbi:hypothetical protein [Pedobacter glucosidilyticus]|uniref:hypothetical protein n=1 Tax=Pedobacter glucosidilyticus TaxID=1122941 RepID=UPI0004284090|nr:hypothetical protein [Pedobacter glucosidilyticus]
MKKFRFNFFAVAAVAIALGTMSFKAATKTAVITQWHLISANGANQQLDVVGAAISDPTVGGQCESEPEQIRCAVEISYDESYNPVGNSVQQVENDTNLAASDRTFRPE